MTVLRTPKPQNPAALEKYLSISAFKYLIEISPDCSVLVDLIHVELEWWDSLSPSWMVLWESIDAENLSELSDIHDLELLKLKICVEDTVVELAHESHRVSPGEVSLLTVVDSQLHVDLWLSLGSNGVWDSLEVLVVRGTLKSVH